jgi:hypothetical protein
VEDCWERTMDHVTTCLYKDKVNNGTSSAVGVFKTSSLQCYAAITDELYWELFMTTETLLM